MNFYTLTFKKKILISLVLILLSFIIIDIGLYFFIQMKSTQTSFIDNKFSKISHFQLNNPQNKDIVFVGSSRTLYQISTNIFKKNNINIYNFGISGAQFTDYPTVIPVLNKANPKQIVISLSVNKLFYKLGMPKLTTLEEVSYYYDIDKIKFLKASIQWVINKHLFLNYSEPIFYKLKALYEKFGVKKAHKTTTKKMKRHNVFIDSSIDYLKLSDCKIFDIKKITNTQTLLKCTNGDGIVIGDNISNKNNTKQYLKIFNLQSIKYIQKLISTINTSKIKVSIILEPTFNNHYSYNLDKIKKQFTDIEIIDLTNFKTKDSFWADDTHLNYKGREKYSKYLSSIFKHINRY